MENQFFAFSQLSWEPELTWGELARRFVIRSQRALDTRLVEAYRLALEADAAMSPWNAGPTAEFVMQSDQLAQTPRVRERVAALGETLSTLGLIDRDGRPADASPSPPVAFDLRRSLVKTYLRMKQEAVKSGHH
jgi:hypothetical protein